MDNDPPVNDLPIWNIPPQDRLATLSPETFEYLWRQTYRLIAAAIAATGVPVKMGVCEDDSDTPDTPWGRSILAEAICSYDPNLSPADPTHPPARFTAYLYFLAAREARQARNPSWFSLEEGWGADVDGEDLDEVLDESETRRAAARVLQQLPAQLRNILIAYAQGRMERNHPAVGAAIAAARTELLLLR